jgi:hypothetical protein
MSIALLELSSGCIVQLSGILCRVKFSFSPVELHIVGAQGSGQGRNRTIAGELAEAALGLDHTGRGPAQNHGAALPAFDPAPDLAHPAEQVLDQVGGRQHPLEIFGQPKAHNGQCFFQPLAQRGGGAGMLMLESAREIAEQALRTAGVAGCASSKPDPPGLIGDFDRLWIACLSRESVCEMCAIYRRHVAPVDGAPWTWPIFYPT